MSLVPARTVALAVLLAAMADPHLAAAQTLPGVFRRSTPQRAADQPPVPTVMRPAEGEVVIGDLVIAVQVPPNVPAREYTLEAAYWDPERNNWAYPGTLGDNFTGGTTATTRIAADMRMKWNQKATRWKIHARVTQPPGSWGEWREFIWQAAPPPNRTAETPPPPVSTPTNTATTGTGGGEKTGTMVPGTTPPPGQQPPTGQPATGTPPATPPAGATETRTVPPPATPPATNVPAVQQPPSTNLPAVQQPPARTVPGVQQPPSTNVPAVQQPPAQKVPNPGPPEKRTPPPTPPSTSVPAVQQPPSTNLPAVQQPPTTTVPAVQQPPATTVPAVQKPPVTSVPQVPRQLPGIPNLPMRLPTSLPKTRSGGAAPPSAGARPAEARPSQLPAEREARLVSMTKLAVWDGKPMPAANQRIYVRGPVDVDWAKKSLLWWFRGMTTAPGAVPGKWRWEMSRTPFASYGPWQATPGIGYAGSADGVQFTVNLNPYAPRPPGWPVEVSAASQPQPGVAGVVAGSLSGTQAPTFSNRSGIPPDIMGAPSGARGEFTPPPTLPPAVQVSLSLFVRVVPLDAAGNDADLPSNFVELRFGAAEKPTPFDPNPKHWPVVSFVSYRPVQAYTWDWQCWVEASTDIKAPVFWNVGVDPGTKDQNLVLFKKGTTRNVCGSDDSNIVDDFVDAVGGFIEMMGKVVDWISKTYSNLKAEVASKLVSAIPGCSTSDVCKGAVQMGLNAGMAALGMPPDLPDFEQLQAMGEGYLLDAVAQQVAAKTGMDAAGELAKQALKEYIAKGKEAMQGGGGGSSPWVPDDSKQYKPLLLTLAVSNPSATGTTPAMYLEVSEPGGKRYLPRTVAVPSLLPTQSVNVSVALDPVNDPKAWMELLPTQAEYLAATSLGGSSGGFGGSLTTDPADKLVQTKSAQADAALKSWRSTYLTGSVNLQAALKQPPFVYKVAYKTQCFADKAMCTVNLSGGTS